MLGMCLLPPRALGCGNGTHVLEFSRVWPRAFSHCLRKPGAATPSSMNQDYVSLSKGSYPSSGTKEKETPTPIPPQLPESPEKFSQSRNLPGFLTSVVPPPFLLLFRSQQAPLPASSLLPVVWRQPLKVDFTDTIGNQEVHQRSACWTERLLPVST